MAKGIRVNVATHSFLPHRVLFARAAAPGLIAHPLVSPIGVHLNGTLVVLPLGNLVPSVSKASTSWAGLGGGLFGSLV